MSSTYTTTTSATGMPTVDTDMNILRTPTVSVSHDSIGSINSPKSPLAAEGSPTRNQEAFTKHRPAFFSNAFPAQNTGSTNMSRISPDRTNAPPSPNFGRRSPERPLAQSPSLIRRNSDKLNYIKHKSKEDLRDVSERNEKENEKENRDNIDSKCKCQCHEKGTDDDDENAEQNLSEAPQDDFVLKSDPQLSKLLDKINDWNFPIFDACNYGNILVQVCMTDC